MLAEVAAYRRASDAFDAAIAGWADLVTSGRTRDAETVAEETFREFERHRDADPDWAAAYVEG